MTIKQLLKLSDKELKNLSEPEYKKSIRAVNSAIRKRVKRIKEVTGGDLPPIYDLYNFKTGLKYKKSDAVYTLKRGLSILSAENSTLRELRRMFRKRGYYIEKNSDAFKMSLYRKVENYLKTNMKEGKPDSESIIKAIDFVFDNYDVNKMSNQELEDLINAKAIQFYSEKYGLNMDEYVWDSVNLNEYDNIINKNLRKL
jgi:hypothetical protein